MTLEMCNTMSVNYSQLAQFTAALTPKEEKYEWICMFKVSHIYIFLVMFFYTPVVVPEHFSSCRKTRMSHCRVTFLLLRSSLIIKTKVRHLRCNLTDNSALHGLAFLQPLPQFILSPVDNTACMQKLSF